MALPNRGILFFTLFFFGGAMKKSTLRKLTAVKADMALWCELHQVVKFWSAMVKEFATAKPVASGGREKFCKELCEVALEDAIKERDAIREKHKDAFARMGKFIDENISKK